VAIRKHIKRLAETSRFAREQRFCTVEKTLIMHLGELDWRCIVSMRRIQNSDLQ